MYDVTNFESFGTMDKLKKDIDKNKEKKEVRIVFKMQFLYAIVFLVIRHTRFRGL